MNNKRYSIKNAISGANKEFVLNDVDVMLKKGVKLGMALYRTGISVTEYARHLEDLEKRKGQRLDGTPR